MHKQGTLDKPVNVVSVHDKANVLPGIKYFVESTVVHVNHHHLRDDTTDDATLH